MAVSVKIDDELKGRVQSLAERRHRSAHSVMRDAIREYVEREDARDSFIQESLDGWAEFNRTGKHITGEELFAWMDTWGTEAETGPPECHD